MFGRLVERYVAFGSPALFAGPTSYLADFEPVRQPDEEHRQQHDGDREKGETPGGRRRPG